MEGICWKRELFYTRFKDERDLDTMMDTVMELGEPEEVFTLVSRMKEKGNEFFKRGKFDLTTAHYDVAAKYLSCTWMVSTVDSDMCKDLAVLLHLNLANLCY